MTIWLDAHLSPFLARWLENTFDVKGQSVRDLGLRDADDLQIFKAARKESAIVMTKDSDFPDLLDRFGPPPQVIWITCGNTSNANLRKILSAKLPKALRLISAGEKLVEISD
jgi:predicted nuclease of predicted toxin-antitoxin system